MFRLTGRHLIFCKPLLLILLVVVVTAPTNAWEERSPQIMPRRQHAAETSRPASKSGAEGKLPPFEDFRGPDRFRIKPRNPKARDPFPAIPEISRKAEGWYKSIITRYGNRFVHKPYLMFLMYKGHSFSVVFPDLPAGRVVRMLDGLYCVDLGDGRTTFIRLKEREIPRGMRPTPGTVGLPIGGDGFYLSLKDVKSDRNGRSIAVFSTYAPELTTSNNQDIRREQTVQEGDIVWKGHYGIRVKKIVPSDPEHNLLGWVDLETHPAKLRGPASFRLEEKPRAPGVETPDAALGFEGYWFNASSKKDNFEGIGIVLNGGNMPGLFDHARDHRYRVTFPRLKVGDAARILDGVYRLADDRGLFKRIPENELPKDARPGPHSYGIPFKGSVQLHHHDPNTQVVAYRRYVRQPKPGVFLKAHLDPVIEKRYRGLSDLTEAQVAVRTARVKKVRGVYWPVFESQWVKAGDLLWIGKYAHRVIQVVPPNPERNLPGWVDIEQKVAKTKQEKAKDGNQ